MSRYKLLGEIWDNCRTKEYKFIKVNLNEILPYHKEYGLLDYNRSYERRVELSTLLDASKECLKSILKKLKPCDKIYVVLDCLPKTNNPITKSFYEKRIAQINYKLMKNMNGNNKVYFVNI